MIVKLIFRLLSRRARSRHMSPVQGYILLAWGCTKCCMHPCDGIPFISTVSQYVMRGYQNACRVCLVTHIRMSDWDIAAGGGNLCCSHNAFCTAKLIPPVVFSHCPPQFFQIELCSISCLGGQRRCQRFNRPQISP